MSFIKSRLSNCYKVIVAQYQSAIPLTTTIYIMEIPDSDDDEEAQFFPEASQNDQHHQQDKTISPAQFIDRVLSQLNTTITQQQQDQDQDQHPSQPNNQNPFSTLSPSELSRVKPLILTLHCLFPNELLLALDILDRGLVRRLVNEDEDQDQVHNGEEVHSFSFPSSSSSPIENSKPAEAIFLVISTSNSTTITREEDKGYEVRLQAWNCSCPSFTISAFRDPEEAGPELDSDNIDVEVDDNVDIPVEPLSSTSSATTTEEYRFGGTLTRGVTRSSPPVCKHLLACVLLVRCPRLFGTGTGPHSRLVVSAKELAGWCAGWGG